MYHVSCNARIADHGQRAWGCRDDGVRRSWHGDHRLRDDRRERIGQYCGWLENWSKRVRYRRYIGVKHHGRGRGKKTKVRHRQGSAFCLLAKRTRLETTARLTLLCLLSSTKKSPAYREKQTNKLRVRTLRILGILGIVDLDLEQVSLGDGAIPGHLARDHHRFAVLLERT